MKTRIILRATEGYVLTNGESFGKEVFLGVNDSPDNWQEITEEEYAEIMRMQEENAGIIGADTATVFDYQNALKRLGVVFNE